MKAMTSTLWTRKEIALHRCHRDVCLRGGFSFGQIDPSEAVCQRDSEPSMAMLRDRGDPDGLHQEAQSRSTGNDMAEFILGLFADILFEIYASLRRMSRRKKAPERQ
jgi:hypothetical protein